jgi:O-antigen/teichoic acid export membrane protein
VIKKFTSKLDIHSLEILVSSSKSMIVKVVGTLAGLLISLILGKTLGVEGLGIFNLVNKVGLVLLVFTLFGFYAIIVKYVSIAKSNKIFENIVATVRSSLVFNGLLSILFAVAGVLTLPSVISLFSDNQDLYYPLLIGYFMLIPQTLARVFAAALNGFGKIWQSNLVDQALSSVLLLIGLSFFYMFDVAFTPISVLLLYAISRVLQLIAISLTWNYYFKFKPKTKVELNLKPLLKMSVPMLFISGTAVFTSNLDSIMLGALSSVIEVGLYSVASKLALLTSFFLAVSNASIGPKIASLFQKRQIAELSMMVKKTNKILFYIAFTTVLSLVFFGKYVLNLWGSEFVSAYPILVILSIGQFFNICTGCSGLLLTMTGFEKEQSYLSMSILVLNIILNIIFINYFGALGAAISTAFTITLVNIIKVILVKKKLGIVSFYFFNI